MKHLKSFLPFFHAENQRFFLFAKLSLFIALFSISGTAIFGQAIVNKPLYLSDPAQALDRIDPADPGLIDNTTATTSTLYPSEQLHLRLFRE